MCIALYVAVGWDSSLQLKQDMKGQLREASSATSKAYTTFRKETDPDVDAMGPGGEGGGAEDSPEEAQMTPAIAVMEPILRFLQLLCENHNRDLQVPARGRHLIPRSLAVFSAALAPPLLGLDASRVRRRSSAYNCCYLGYCRLPVSTLLHGPFLKPQRLLCSNPRTSWEKKS